MVYRYKLLPINLYVWPGNDGGDAGRLHERQGLPFRPLGCARHELLGHFRCGRRRTERLYRGFACAFDFLALFRGCIEM